MVLEKVSFFSSHNLAIPNEDDNQAMTSENVTD
jgi:hypothetical protein